MKTKVSTLRSQNLELERKVSETESTVQTLRDERNVIESTLEEKKNEIEELKILLEKAIDAQAANNNASTAFESFGTQEESATTDTVVITNSTNDGQQGRSGDESGGGVEREKEPEKLNDSATDAGTNKEEGVKKQTVDKTEQLENKTIDSQSNQAANETRRNKDDERNQSTGRSDDPRDEEESFRRGGVKLEKSDGSEFEHGLGSGVGRSHSNGKKWRVIVRNRRMGQSLYSVSKGAEEAVIKHSNGKTETVTTMKEKMSSNSEEALNKESVEKSDELIRYKSGNEQASGEPEKMQREDETEHANDNEQREVEKEEAEVEDVEEDAETIEPEIDRADIQRISESDHDEETEEQEPEF